MPGILADQQHPPDLGDEAETRPPCTDVTKSSDAAAACPLPRHSSSPESDLNHSSSTCTTSEGECKETPNDPTVPEELDSPLDQSSNQPNQTEPEMEESPPDKEPPIKQKRPVKGPFATELTTMNIHIVLPGVQHPIDAVVSSRDTVHDLLQFSLERPEGCYRTCLSVRFKKKRLDDFFELGAVQDMQDGSTVELVEEPYTQKDIRIHVQRLRDLLAISANPLTHSLSSASGLSLSFLSAITLKDPTEGVSRGQESVDPTQLEPPAWSLPQEHPHPPPLTPFYPPSLEAHFKVPECLKSLSYSSWNPPPGYRKMKGDLLYIDLTTLEGQEYYITSCPTGFYLNRSTDRDHFDPTPRKTALHSRHLVGLLSQISPLFKKNFLQLQKFGEKKHAFELFPAPYPVSTWVTPKPEHRPMNFRIDDGVSLKGAPDELLLGQLRDWNEELQLARELPSDTDQQKAFRDRTLFKIHAEFVQAAAKGAVEVMDGYIPSVNPGDEEKHRMYMWNNIFYSLAFDGRDYYEDFGGDDGAHAAAGGDLNGVASFEKLDVKGLCTLGTVVVDYRGVRVVCQTIIPGLLQREQESSVVYGSIDGGKNILANEKFKELLKKPAKELHIREHKLLTEKDEVVELPSSLELKGIIGTDSRHYALDLFRLFPPDRVYMDCEEYQLRHRLSVLRPELLETFLQYRYMLFLKLAKEKAGELNIFKKLQMFMPILRANKKDEASENGEESENSADTVATVEAKVSGEESNSQPPGEGQVCGEESSSQPQGEGQVCGEESSGQPPGEGQVCGEESSGKPPGEGQVCGEESSGKPPGEGQLSGEESSSQPQGEGQVCGEESSSQPPGEGQVCGEESSSQPPGEGQVSGEESSVQPPGEGQVSGEESSGQPPGEGQVCGGESSSQPPKDGQASGQVSESTCDLTVVADSASKKPETTKFESQSKEPNSNLSEEREIGLEDQAKERQSQTKTPLPDPAPQSNEPHTTTTGDNQDTSSNTSSPPAKSKSSASNISADLTNLEALSALLGSNSSNLLILSTDEGQYSQPVTLSEALAGLPGLTVKKVSSAEGEGEPDDDSQDMKNLLDPLDASDIESFSSNPTLLKVLQEAAKESGYGENLDFDIRFNVDILSPGARHADPEAVLESDHNLIDAVTLFLVRIVLPHFLRNCVQLSTMPLDGGALREAMRSQGINVRYLGIIAVMVRQRDDLQHVMRLTVSEMVVRIARRRLRKLMQEAPVQKLSEAIAHFLNCFLGEAETGRDHGEELPLMNGQSRKKQKKKKATKSRSQPESLYLKMTAKDLWDSIVEEIGWYYRYNLTHSCLGEACSEYGIQRLSLLRELCKKTGVQMVLREYDFSAKPTFTEEDIVSLYPIIKHTNFRPADAVTLLEYAQSKSGNFTNKLARPLYLEALRLFLQVYGPMHVDIADCYGKLADLSLENGDFVDALSNQHKATLILERVLGVDHAQTVFSYIKLANCCQQTNQTSAALRLMYRVRYLILLLHGEDHPHLAACDSNIALLLWSIKDTKNSYCFFQNSLPLYQKYYGKTSTQAALSHHHLARVQCSFGDFRSALQHEKAAYSIYSKKFGVDSEQTKESSAFLQELTEKAVTIQKTLNEMTGKGKPTGTGAKALLLGSWGDVTSMMTKRHGKTNVKKRSKKHPNPPDKASQD